MGAQVKFFMLVVVLGSLMIMTCEGKDCYHCGDACGEGSAFKNKNETLKMSVKCAQPGSNCYKFVWGPMWSRHIRRGCASGSSKEQANFTSITCKSNKEPSKGTDFSMKQADGTSVDGKLFCCESNECNSGTLHLLDVTMVGLVMAITVTIKMIGN